MADPYLFLRQSRAPPWHVPHRFRNPSLHPRGRCLFSMRSSLPHCIPQQTRSRALICGSRRLATICIISLSSTCIIIAAAILRMALAPQTPQGKAKHSIWRARACLCGPRHQLRRTLRLPRHSRPRKRCSRRQPRKWVRVQVQVRASRTSVA